MENQENESRILTVLIRIISMNIELRQMFTEVMPENNKQASEAYKAHGKLLEEAIAELQAIMNIKLNRK